MSVAEDNPSIEAVVERRGIVATVGSVSMSRGSTEGEASHVAVSVRTFSAVRRGRVGSGDF